MQDAREQGVRLSRSADVDDPGVLKFVGEDVDDQFEHVVGEQTECAVDEYPGRPLQQDACDGEAKLLVLTQLPIPTLGLVEQRREAFKAGCAPRVVLNSTHERTLDYVSLEDLKKHAIDLQ